MTKQGKIIVLGGVTFIIVAVVLTFAVDWRDLRIKKEIRQAIQQQEIDKAKVTETLTDIEISLRDWYTHRMNDGFILLTRQEELPEIGTTEVYAYGEQIIINILPLDVSPEEWATQKTHIDLDDVLVLESEWSTFYGQKLLVVESEAGGTSGKQYTQYLFTDDIIYVISLYPFEIYDTSSEKYVRNTNVVYDARGILHRLLPHILAQESVQRQLAENCANVDISQRSDDSSLDPENKVVTIWLWDEESQDTTPLILPYKPETDFEGCSESAKTYLRHLPNDLNKN